MALTSAQSTKQSYDPAGNLVTTTYNADGSVARVTTVVTNQDGSTTTTAKTGDGAVSSIVDKAGDGSLIRRVSANDDGTISLSGPAVAPSPAGGGTTYLIVSGDGKTPLSRVTQRADGGDTKETLNPDGSVKSTVTRTPEQVTHDANADNQANFSAHQTENNDGSSRLYNNSLTDVWKNDIKGAIRGTKGFLDSTNPVGTPGLNNDAVTNYLLGQHKAGESIFSQDTLGQYLAKAAGSAGGVAGLGGGGGGVTTQGISDATAKSGAMSQQFLDAYNTAQSHPSPQATAALATAIQAQGSAPVNAATITPTQMAALVQAQGSAPVNAATMTPAQIAAYIEAQKGGPIDPGVAIAAHSKAAQADPSVRAALAKYDTSNELAARSNQEGLVSGLQGAIAGTDPSVAAILLRQATDRNIANQYALAASSPGMSAGLAQRQAMMGAADLNSKAAADNAILRAKEITDARAQLAEVLGAQRTADINVATTQYTGEQGVNSDFAKAQNDRSNLNAQLLNTSNISNASNDTNVSQSNAQNRTTVNTTAASLANAIEIANANNRETHNEKQADLINDAAKTNVGSLNSTNQFNATQLQQNNQYNAGQANTYDYNQANLTQDANKSNQKSYNDTNQFNATQLQQLNEYNTGQTNDISKTNANNQTNVNQTNTTAQLTQQQIDALARQNAAKNAIDTSGQVITGQVGLAEAQARAAEAQAKKDANTTELWTKLGTAIVSDGRLKKNIKPAEPDIAELLSAIEGREKSFRYKDPTEPGTADGERFGLMAQDLERSRAGKALVRNTPRGKVIDSSQAVMTALAALGHLAKRVDKMERSA